MWLLVMTLLTNVPGLDTVTVLNAFSTYGACAPERDRVGYQMAEAYPHERVFTITCRYSKRRAA